MMMLAACLVFAGCMSLALGQDRNWKAVTGTSPIARTRMAIRTVGWAFLGAAVAVSAAAEGPGFAVLLWTLQVAMASFLVAMTLSFRPGWFKPVARAYSMLWS